MGYAPFSSPPFFVSTKFHFDETISLAGLVSLSLFVRSSFVVPHLWKLCDGITSVILELHFWDLVHCLLISFCFGSEILKKNRTTPTPKKNQKTPKKRLMDFHDGISCQRFELEGWDLVQCLLISFCF